MRIFDEILSGFRDKFQKRVTCVAFSIKFAKTNQKFAENSEFCEKNSLLLVNYSLRSLVSNDLHVEVTAGVLSRRAPPHIQRSRGPRPERSATRRPIGKISAKCCSFSAVSAPIFARKYAFCSIFQNLPDFLAKNFEIWQSFANFVTFAKILLNFHENC